MRAVEVEGLTDLVLPDTIVRPNVLHEILLRRLELGLRNIIVIKTSRQTPSPTKQAQNMLLCNLQQIKAMPGILFMDDLLVKYAATPIAYGSGTNDEAAVIVHSSGTTKGTHKPIPLSDVALNTAATRLLANERFSLMHAGAVVLWPLPISFSTGLVNIVYMSLAFGATLRLSHGVMDLIVLSDALLDLEKHEVNVLFVPNRLLEEMMANPKAQGLDVPALEPHPLLDGKPQGPRARLVWHQNDRVWRRHNICRPNEAREGVHAQTWCRPADC